MKDLKLGYNLINEYGLGVQVVCKEDMSSIEFKAGDAIRRTLLNQSKIDDGRTVGQANHDFLHKCLDSFLDDKTFREGLHKELDIFMATNTVHIQRKTK